jgi:hypothetical protein
MKEAFLIFAVLLNAGFAVVVFWWLLREYRRPRQSTPPERPAEDRPAVPQDR